MLEKSGIPNSRSLINHNQIYKNFFDSNAILKYKKLNEKSQNEFERLSNKFKLFVCSSMKAPDSISKSTETHTEMNARNWFQIKYIPEMHASSKVKDGNVLYEQIDPADHDVLSFDSEPTEFVHQSLMNYKLILNEVSPSELDYSRHQRFKDLLKLKKDKRKEKIQECSNGIHSQYSPYFITDIGKLHQDTTTHFDGKEEEQPKKRPKLEKVDDSVSGTFFKNLTSF
uniref:Protein TSSC4 n=1 Tax=Parastrongyloides trichosuri TaxID=131310 RepID=A0A0N4ZUV0_PARTI